MTDKGFLPWQSAMTCSMMSTRDSHADSDEDYDECDDMDTLDQPSSSHTPTTVQISSDSEQEEPQNGAQDVLPGRDGNETRHLKQTQDARVQLESLANSKEGGQEGGYSCTTGH